MKSKYLLCGVLVGAIVVAAILLNHKEILTAQDLDENWRFGC
jgi:gas vesicle protein